MIEIDIQTGFKLASEKRARNRAASGRFRQRYKDKERETKQYINRLMAQISHLEEENIRLGNERDAWREQVLLQQTSGPGSWVWHMYRAEC